LASQSLYDRREKKQRRRRKIERNSRESSITTSPTAIKRGKRRRKSAVKSGPAPKRYRPGTGERKRWKKMTSAGIDVLRRDQGKRWEGGGKTSAAEKGKYLSFRRTLPVRPIDNGSWRLLFPFERERERKNGVAQTMP